jgi:hypothetical protein
VNQRHQLQSLGAALAAFYSWNSTSKATSAAFMSGSAFGTVVPVVANMLALFLLSSGAGTGAAGAATGGAGAGGGGPTPAEDAAAALALASKTRTACLLVYGACIAVGLLPALGCALGLRRTATYRVAGQQAALGAATAVDAVVEQAVAGAAAVAGEGAGEGEGAGQPRRLPCDSARGVCQPRGRAANGRRSTSQPQLESDHAAVHKQLVSLNSCCGDVPSCNIPSYSGATATAAVPRRPSLALALTAPPTLPVTCDDVSDDVVPTPKPGGTRLRAISLSTVETAFDFAPVFTPRPDDDGVGDWAVPSLASALTAGTVAQVHVCWWRWWWWCCCC